MTEGGERVSEGYPDEDPGGSFSFTVQRLSAGITIIWAEGELDRETSSQLYQLVSDELLGKPAQLVLEFSDLTS
ncbi:MAG: hypothetical protein QOD34_1672, partial [Mycobacterium sp.]|nr:hypothetical protein [Mycobacterium sp.]